MYARPDLDGLEQLRLLGAAWADAVQYWRDEVARQFDTDHWTPLAEQSRAYLEALGALLDLLESADRETES